MLPRRTCEISLLVLEAVPTEHQEVTSKCAPPGAALRVSLSGQTVTPEASQLTDFPGTAPRKQLAEKMK